MRIRRLKLAGFKSFVESAELRIESGLTGVVGPNGCGKSNLLEAIRWVMGEGSPKSLRGGGMEDVIFAGTATRPQRDFAEVSLLIEREADEESAGSESEVTRRIERGAGSAYRVDGRDVRQKDVALLFADAATGAHSPALVSQGRIGAVIAAKPVERRLMLEEAAGISGLHARRKDAEQKLRATEANLTRLDEMLGDQEARASALKRQARAAERYRQLSERIRAAEARLLYARWREADAAARAASDDARHAAQAVAGLQQAMEEARLAQQQANAQVTARRSAVASARDSGRALAHELAAARARHDTAVRRLAELGRLQEALASERARETSLSEDAGRAIAALDAERSAIEAHLSDAESQAARVAAELTAAESRSRELEAGLAALLAREAALRAERRVAEAALDTARAQVDRADAEAARLDRQIEELGDGAEHAAAREAAVQSLAEATRAASAAEAAMTEAEKGRTLAAEQRDEHESALAAAKAALAAAASEREALARALAQGGGAALADVRAESGYERALAAALGDDLEAAVGGDGPRRWVGSEAQAGDPPLASGLESLAAHASTPPELARRMAQVAVAEEDEGQKLAIGQRLVTRNGRMRRWDGFVAETAGAAAAERLIRANRLAEIDRDLPSLEAAASNAAAARDQAAAAVEKFRQDAEKARSAAVAAERLVRESARAADTAAGALERLELQRSALVERRADLEPLIAASRESVTAAQAALEALAEPALLADETDRAREAAMAAGQAVAELRAASATRAREMAADRERDAAAQREQGEWRARARKAEERLLETAQRAEEYSNEQRDLAGEPERLSQEVSRLEESNQANDALLAEAIANESEAEDAAAAVATKLAEAGEAFAVARETRAGAVARAEAQEARRGELARECGEQFECPPPLLPERLGFDPDALAEAEAEKSELDRMIAERERIGPVNLVAERELAELEESRIQGAAERDELQEAINRLRGSIGSLNREGRVRLLEAYGKVDKHFRSLFTTLFDGGQAHLELVESDDPLEAGLEIMAQPPGKRLSALTLLSGGEQALTAIALIFALFLTNPAPICVLDEVDAPLDDANVERFCDLLDRMTAETDTRYLIVTHNAVTMSRMHRLYGVTMVEKGVSRLVSVDLGGAETLLAAE